MALSKKLWKKFEEDEIEESEIYGALWNFCIPVVVGFGLDEYTAKDITKKVLKKVIEKKKKGEEINNIQPYLRIALKRTALNLRKIVHNDSKKTKVFEELDETNIATTDSTIIFDPVEELEREDLKKERAAFLGCMEKKLGKSSKIFQYVSLHFFEYKNSTQIAEQLDVSDGTISNWKRKIVPDLKDCFAKSYDGLNK